MKKKLARLLFILTIIGSSTRIHAQGTAFTYQGQLQNNGHLVSGVYNLTFSLFNTNIAGMAVAGPVTNNGVVVSNGLFNTTIDFGTGVFTGATNWLEINVESNGLSSFITLIPRQQLTPIPYAIFANTASNLSGTVSVSQLIGTVSQQQLPSDIITQNESGISLTGTFSGDGSGLYNTVTTENYVHAFDTTTHTISTIGTFQNISFTAASTSGWFYFNGPGNTFTCNQSGLYLVRYDAEASTTSSSVTTISLRVFNQGTSVETPDSELSITLTSANQITPISKGFLAFFTTGSLLQLQFAGNNTSAQLIAGSGAAATQPSVALTIIRIQ